MLRFGVFVAGLALCTFGAVLCIVLLCTTRIDTVDELREFARTLGLSTASGLTGAAILGWHYFATVEIWDTE